LAAVTRRLPHPILLLLFGVAAAALLTWLVPAGEYTRVLNEATGREVVVPGTYAPVASAPASPWAAALAVPRGISDGIEVILTVLIIGAAFALLDATGAFARLLGALLGRGPNPRLVLVAVSVVCAMGGAAEQMHEEFIALMPVLVVLSRRLGFGALTAVMMSMGAAAVGAAFGPTNPFGTGIALRMAELPPGSAIGFRIAVLAVAVALWIAWTLYRAPHDDVRPDLVVDAVPPPTWRDVAALLALGLPIVIYVVGVLRFDWGFNQLTAMFLVAGFVVGILQRLSLEDTTKSFIRGMETMLGAGLMVGIARAISVVLTDGRVIDTLIAWAVAPLEAVPPMVAALADDSGTRADSHPGAIHQRASGLDDADHGADRRPARIQPRCRRARVPGRWGDDGLGEPDQRRDARDAAQGRRPLRPMAAARAARDVPDVAGGGGGHPDPALTSRRAVAMLRRSV
jgi:uncharacterized ion transporter superfamily protein YfcC